MLSLIKARFAGRERDEGFTLIELMVVVLIIAILIAIAIPTFLGARQKAQDRAAQSDLRNALTAAKTGYVDTQDYSAVALASIEPSLTYVSGASSGPAKISVFTDSANPGEIGMASLAADNVCWQLFDSATGTAGTTFGSVSNSSATTCTAPTAALSASHW